MDINPELKIYLAKKRWKYRPATEGNIAVQVCPFCGKDKWKFWIHAQRTMYRCWVCDARGNLYKLKRELGDLDQLVSAAQLTDADGKKKNFKPVDMERVEKWHKALKASKEALAYCTKRGFTIRTINHFKIGMQKSKGKYWLTIPHIVHGICKNVKFRSLPPTPKAFKRVGGSESVLFNEDALANHDSIVIAESETDAMAFWQAGVENVVGLTGGAETFLPEWYDLLCDKEKITICLDADTVGQSGARSLARRLGFDRCENVLLPSHDANELLVQAGEQELANSLKHTEKFEVSGVLSAADVMLQCRDMVSIGDTGLLTQWPSVNRLIGNGWSFGDLVVLSAKVKTGKSLKNSERVQTPDGLVPIGSVKVGDRVMGTDGKPHNIVGVFPQGELDIYRVAFSDGVHLDVSLDHLWQVSRNQVIGREPEVLTTEQIMKEGLRFKSGWRFRIPMADPLEFEERPVPLDPYLVGVCIGDGCLSRDSATIANSDSMIRADLLRAAPTGASISDVDGCTFRIVYRGQVSNPIRAALGELGLLGKRSFEKFIPGVYLHNSVENRVKMLQGLLDTDGTVDKNGTISFSTASEKLCETVTTLVQSLGGRVKLKTKIPKFQGKEYRMSYILHISIPGSVIPFRRKHKLDRFNEIRSKRGHSRNFRSIVGIEYVGRSHATCISVDSPDNLFVAEHGIVTHNTTWAINLAVHQAMNGIPSLIYCLEMQPRRLAEKVACIIRKKVREDLNDVDFAMARYMLRRIPLYFVEPEWGGELKRENIINKIRESVKRYGIKFLVFDHLHFLCRSLQYMTNEIGQITRDFKLLTEELEIVTILVAQPKKLTSGKVMTYDDIKDSSAIPADADQVVILHRNPIPAGLSGELGNASDQEVLESKTLIRVDAARFRGGGETYLNYDGAKATFSEREKK